MRIVIETRVELTDHGTKERRIELEMSPLSAPDTVILIQKLVDVADGPSDA
jgi:hypothetical protein